MAFLRFFCRMRVDCFFPPLLVYCTRSILFWKGGRTVERKIWNWIRSKNGLLVCLVMAVFCLAVAAWNWYAAPQVEGDVYEYTKYNDEYDRTLETQPGSWEITQTLTLDPDQRVYGLRLLFGTGGVSCQGEFEARLESPEGQLLATTGVLNAATLLDGDFQGLPFAGANGFFQDNPHLDGEAYPQVVLRLIYTAAPDWTTPLTLWYGETSAQAGQMTLNGEEVSGSLALQLMTENATGWTARMALVVMLPLLAAVAAAFLLSLKGAPLPLTAGVCIFLLGVSFALITPAQVAPDEYAHIAACYEKVSELSGQPTLTRTQEGETILVRDCDYEFIQGETGPIGPAGYKHFLVEVTKTGQSGELTQAKALRLTQTQTWYLFLPQLAGVALARALGLSFYGLVLLGRLFNLLAFLGLTLLALRLVPGSSKGVLAGVALLPISLQLAGSFSPDAFTLGISFCLVALCLAGCHRILKGWEWALLVLLAFLLIPAKIIYLPMVALCAIIPARHLSAGRRGLILKGILFLAGAAGMVVFSGDYLGYILRDVDDVFLQGIIIMGAIPALLAFLLGMELTRDHPRLRSAFWRVVIYGAILGAVGMVFVLGKGKYPITEDELLHSIQPNGDSKYFYTVGYIIHHLSGAVKVIWNSLLTSSGEWLQGLLGTSLGEPIVYPIQVNSLLGAGLMIVLLLWALRTREEAPRLNGWQSWMPLGVTAGVFVLCLGACLTWTPINYTVLFGVQGRYFLPVLPLFLLWVGETKRITLEGNVRRWLVPAQTVLVFLVLCQGFLLYCQGA